MIRKLDLKLYRSLITSEFFLDIHNKSNIGSGRSKLMLIDIVNQLKGLKQFIRLVRLYKKRIIKEIVILVNNKFLYYFILNYLKKVYLHRVIKVYPYVSNKLGVLKSNTSRMVIQIGSVRKKFSFLKKLFSLNFLLIQTFSRQRLSKSSYHVPTNIVELKKLLFILILLTNILRNKKKNAVAK